MVEGVGHGAARAGLSDTGEEQTQQGSDIHRRSDCGAGCCPDCMLIHNNRRSQVSDFIYLRAVVMGHLVPQKQRIALLPLALGFDGNGVKGQ